MAKFVCVYLTKNRVFFCDLDKKAFYYQNNVDFKSWKYTLPFILTYFLLEKIEKIYYSMFSMNFKVWVYIITNLFLLFCFMLITKDARKKYHPYYPSKYELYDSIEMIKKNYHILMISGFISTAIVILSTIFYLNSGLFIWLLGESVFMFFMLLYLFYNGLFYKRKLIIMIENKELP